MDNPDLQDHLAALEAELEEGDITVKGYEKRRALLLAQYGIRPESIASTAGFSLRPDSIASAAGFSLRPDSIASAAGFSLRSRSSYQAIDPTGGTSTMTSATLTSPQQHHGDTASGGAGARGSFLQPTNINRRSNSNGTFSPVSAPGPLLIIRSRFPCPRLQ